MTEAMARTPETGPARSAGDGYEPPYIAAALVAFGVWVLYFVTLAPTTAFWDTSEYIATAHILGIPHPPGNPLFVVLGRAWDLLLAPTGMSVAVRINLFSATMSALAHGFWFLLVHRMLAFYSENRAFRLVGAAIAVIISATAFTVWNQSNVNEKVYTVSLFTIALLSWLAFHWRDNLGHGKDDNLILLMIYILALSVGNHLMAFLAAPALVVLILLVEPRTLMNWRLYALGALVAVIGLSIHVFLPLRASLDPVINEADPGALTALWESLSRQQYDKPSVFVDPTSPEMPRGIQLVLAQVGNYFQYFDWQWARSVAGNASLFAWPRPLFTLVFAGLGIWGAWTHYLRDRASFWFMMVLYATLSIGLVGYLNFRYGYSFPEPGGGFSDAAHEVRERDYFFIVSFSVWGLWAGMGLAALWQEVAASLKARFQRANLRYAVASPLLAVAFVPLLLNWGWASRADDYAARDWAYNLLMSVEPYGVLFTNGDNDTFPLWYLQEVEGLRQDVTVIVMSYLNTPWYARQIRALTTPCAEGQDPLADPTTITCQRPYEPDEGPSFYLEPARQTDTGTRPVDQVGAADAPVRAPTRSIIGMTEAQIDSVPLRYAENPYNFVLNRPLEVDAGSFTFTVEPGRVLLPSDIFMLHILQTAIGDRPVYYATTTQSYNRVGLGDRLLRQGVAFKVMEDSVPRASGRRGIHELPEGGRLTGRYLDLPRTDSLLWNVFQHRGGIPDDWDKWVDASTQNIPYYYAIAHYSAILAHTLEGEQDAVQRHTERMTEWLELSQR